MDGGPHQVIPPGTIWKPFWKITNNAATYWYHPHLHEMTLEHLSKGIGGLLIVNDEQESALPLPRTYGIEDMQPIISLLYRIQHMEIIFWLMEFMMLSSLSHDK
jgi:bilirubin oxidase